MSNTKLFQALLKKCFTDRITRKREGFVDDTLRYAKSLYEELEISFEPPRRIRRRHIFGDRNVDVGLSYENQLERTMFTSVDRIENKVLFLFFRTARPERSPAPPALASAGGRGLTILELSTT
ncbi:hypothetical protein EVAR_63767_1 [Eumeta japonica]|uniref:Uncharacterized protein n=1 Tax=Eumeta variegata TaxID=151549 RepID=A0A4C1ZPW7_EUMVA|nr:hypothetical protein EVAR_63767_1 [Eumeta japonica]